MAQEYRTANPRFQPSNTADVQRLMVLAVVMATAGLAGAQAPAPRAYLVVVDDVHLAFRSTPRTRKLLQDLSKSGREDDTWSLITTGSPGLRMEPTKGGASLRAWVNRVTGNALALREQLNAFGDPERTAIVRRRASLTDIVIAQAIERVAGLVTGPLTIVYLTDGYDARMVPSMSEVVRATGEARAALVAISVPGQFAEQEPPADVRPEEWTAFAEASRASLLTLAEQTGGIAVFSREQLDAVFASLSQPRR